MTFRMAQNQLISRTAFDLQKVRVDLARRAFNELSDRNDFAEMRGLLDGREEAVAQRMAWKAFLSALDGKTQN